MRKIFSLLTALVFGICALQAQQLSPITWQVSVVDNSATSATVRLDAKIAKGWHLYGLQLPEDGPNATSITFNLPDGVKADGQLTPSREPIEKFDPIFSLKLSWWDTDVSFTQKLAIADGRTHQISAKVFFQGCNDQTCISPQRESYDLTVGTGAAAADTAAPDSAAETADKVPGALATDNAAGQHTDWWAPVEIDAAQAEQTDVQGQSWLMIFILGFGGGLLALLTPCVWPMIPMTVSFFLKRGKSKRKAVGDAIIYGLSIIVIYLTLGIAITLIFGPSKLNELATNAWFNLAFFALLVVFGISFLGGFDITLPSKWSNSIDSKAETTTGLLSIFFMAFTLALVSFSCTGPIIGTLLVEAVTSGTLIGPAIGMAGFAVALALPFSLFAMFPTWLKEMPKSGGWLNSVKVVLGFLELALSLKFLSVADLAYGWGILDREVFVSLWIIIFGLLGLYLLGKLNFPHDTPVDRVSIPRFFMALVSLSFAIYMVPGLWGAPLKSISAFVPPAYTQDFSLYTGGQFEEFDDFDKGMEYARDNHRPVLIDFSGYGCVNCRKMEGAVFDTQVVEGIIKENFVLIKLMVDDKAELATPITVEENGRKVTLETVGDKWSYLQRHKFQANSQPYYIILDNDGRALTAPTYYDENVNKFVEWLKGGLEEYK